MPPPGHAEREFFPNLISGPFHSGLVVVFAFGAALALLAAIASVLRGANPAAKTGGPPTGTPAETLGTEVPVEPNRPYGSER
ncbi:hypothetical protein GCM10010331_23900 [Streptomyces xanthochromogenes]|uniref:hypothetical protein n=1 Tax=Streptomyces xanthochromogenes TaxID=67384 RepID=UPI0016759C21|nr:hypothetical protein [Streptomyces xanthochromogenes]GHB35729.1 hypothetical protein GCM10010331_23900 [Streptomyces xanthochromogenes]